MAEVRITEMQRGTGKTTKFKNTELGRFACVVGGIEVWGARLMRSETGETFVSGPTVSSSHGREPAGMRFADPALKRRLADLAAVALADLPPEDGDETPQGRHLVCQPDPRAPDA